MSTDTTTDTLPIIGPVNVHDSKTWFPATETVETCTRCGRDCRLCTFNRMSDEYEMLVIYARDEQSNIICDVCVAATTVHDVIAYGSAVAYVDSVVNCTGSQALTTFGGTRIGRVTCYNTSRSGWQGSAIHYWSGYIDTPEGEKAVYGRNGGSGLAITVRATKQALRTV